MKRLMMWVTLTAAGGGGLMAMSAAHAAAFTPVRSTAEATPGPSIGDEPQAPFQMPKTWTGNWIFVGKQTASQAYGSPAVGVPMRVGSLDVDQPATGGTTTKTTFLQKLVASPCPPVLATCDTMYKLVAVKEPFQARAYAGEEVLDLAADAGERALVKQQGPINLEEGMDWQYWMGKVVKAYLAGSVSHALEARLGSLDAMLDVVDRGGAR